MVVFRYYFDLRVFSIGFTMAVMVLTQAIDPSKTEVKTEAAGAGATTATGNCSCGGFAAEALPTSGAEPLLAQSPMTVTCDTDGELTCRTLCAALATATKAKGPEILCMRLGNATNLKLVAYSKVCTLPWLYCGMKAEEPLCCANSKATQCATATLAADAAALTTNTTTTTAIPPTAS